MTDAQDHIDLVRQHIQFQADKKLDVLKGAEFDSEKEAMVRELIEDLGKGAVAFAALCKVLLSWERDGHTNYLGDMEDRYVSDCARVMKMNDRMLAMYDDALGEHDFVKR